ncbi:GNAT family N-acetyltransferase [Salinithrix halophila]|uniref:GNAT family N-acetyltransferase n=1 Tax=Salinithrix halophila TaxID=1485204 RepID=A0ABV8JK67_9BACL
MTITLRQAVAGDFPFVFELNKMNMRPYVEEIRGWNDEDEWTDMKRKFRPGQDCIILAEGEPIGIFAVDKEESGYYLRHIELLPHCQGTGIGSALIRDLLQTAGEENLPVYLTVLKHSPARHFYQQLGFYITGEKGIKYQMVAYPPR